MKNFKILSLILVGTFTLGVLGGCDLKKSDTSSSVVESVQVESGNTIGIAESTIVPSNLANRFADYKNVYEDYSTGVNLFKSDIVNQEYVDKYGFQHLVDKGTYLLEEIQQVNPEYYDGFSTTFWLQCMNPFTRYDLEKTYLSQIQNYLDDVYLNKDNTGYILSSDYSSLNPKQVVQKYLKDNKIKISDIIYPDEVVYSDFTMVGTYAITVDVTFKGTKNKKDFEDVVRFDFYFVAPKDIREGATFRTKDLGNMEGEITAVTNSYYDENSQKYDYDKLETYYKNK